MGVKWEYGVVPSVDGWYPILKCWDPEEGNFPDAIWWGSGLPHNDWGRVMVIMQRYDSYEEAKAIAYENDPDWVG